MGMWELVVVLIVGLVVLGPERLPVAIRTVSRWINTVKSVANSVKAEVSEEIGRATSELQSHSDLVCRLLLEKKKKTTKKKKKNKN